MKTGYPQITKTWEDAKALCCMILTLRVWTANQVATMVRLGNHIILVITSLVNGGEMRHPTSKACPPLRGWHLAWVEGRGGRWLHDTSLLGTLQVRSIYLSHLILTTPL